MSNKVNVASNKLLIAILSMSLITVMAGAALAPALGVIKSHFSDSSDLLIQFLISLPAFFIILMSLFFSFFIRRFKTRTIAVTGLILYVVSGMLPYLMENLALILVCRAFLGISVGLLMPLSTGLLAYYYPPQKVATLMGLSASMNQFGGLIATLLAGLLASVSWNSSFLVYLMGVFSLALIVFWLPNENISNTLDVNEKEPPFTFNKLIRRFHPSLVGMLLCMILFFVYPANFAMITMQLSDYSPSFITGIMLVMEIFATASGLLFGKLMRCHPKQMKFFSPFGFIIGYTVFLMGDSLSFLLVGSICIGFANGVGIPYLNTIASIKGGRTAISTIMPLLSASLYVGQFLSPIIVNGIALLLSPSNIKSAYAVAILIALVFLVQTYTTRHFQSLPPKEK